MLPASNRGVGMNMGFPDVCPTPVGPAVVPIPYPNLALHAQAAPFAATVMISGMNALNMGSIIPMTHGDEAGVAGPHMGPGKFTMGNPTVIVGGLPAVNLTTPTTGNSMVNPLGAVLVPAVTTVFYGLRSTSVRDERDELDELAAAMRDPALRAELTPMGVGYLAWTTFTLELSSRIARAIATLEAEGARALVIDLRGSPGGDIDAALRLAAAFLDDGEVLAIERDSEGDSVVHRARNPRTHAAPLAVLVDGRTASAAEIFAGALAARGRAVVVGERTYGKGSMQRMVSREGGVTRATVAHFELDDGRVIDGQGLEPDFDTTGLDANDALATAGILALAQRAAVATPKRDAVEATGSTCRGRRR